MTGQLDLFDGVKLAEPELTTTVRLRRKTVQIPLRKKRREAINRLMGILEELGFPSGTLLTDLPRPAWQTQDSFSIPSSSSSMILAFSRLPDLLASSWVAFSVLTAASLSP